MSKHTDIRNAIINQLKKISSEEVLIIDGFPPFIEQRELPAIAVYLTDAQYLGKTLDADDWEAVLHIHGFLKSSLPDSALDSLVENAIYPVVNENEQLYSLVDNFYPIGYEYSRDDEMSYWSAVDLTFKIEYTIGD